MSNKNAQKNTPTPANRADYEIAMKCQPYVALMASLIFGRFDDFPCSVSVSHSGEFGDGFADEFKAHKKASDAFHAGDLKAFKKAGLTPGITSPGFGYCDTTLNAMKERHFHTGPAVALIMNNFGEPWDQGYPDTKALVSHPLNVVKEHFESFGISCFLARGGTWPGDTDECALVFDISDPEFLSKIKPDFFAHFTDHETEQICHPNHMNTQELMDNYCAAVMMQLRGYGQKIGAIYKDGIKDNLMPIVMKERDILQRAIDQAEYHLRFATESIDAMLPVLSPEERGDLIMELAQKLAGTRLENDVSYGVGDNICTLDY